MILKMILEQYLDTTVQKLELVLLAMSRGLVYDDLLNKYPNLLDETKKETTIK